MKSKLKVIIGLTIFVITLISINQKSDTMSTSKIEKISEKNRILKEKKVNSTVKNSKISNLIGKKSEASFEELIKRYEAMDLDEINQKIALNSQVITESGLVLAANTTGLNGEQKKQLRLLLREGNALKSLKLNKLMEQY